MKNNKQIDLIIEDIAISHNFDSLKKSIKKLIKQRDAEWSEMIEDRLKGLKEKNDLIIEKHNTDRRNYNRNKDSRKLLETVKLNEGSNASYFGGILVGKIEILEELFNSLKEKK